MKAFFFVAIVILICALLLWGITRSEKAERKEKKFDERQLIARDKASRYALVAVVVYLFADYLIALNGAWAVPGIDAYIGIFVGIGVFVVECIRHDAYFANGESGIDKLIPYALFDLLYWYIAIRHLRAGDLLEDGMASENTIPLVVAVWGLAVFAASALRLLRAKREDAEDADA